MITTYATKAPHVELCRWAGLNRSVYYYRPTQGKPGARPSQYTYHRDGSRVSNDVIVEEIKDILSDDFVSYGYDLTTDELRSKGYIINKKKVYRIMEEHHLLLGSRIRTSGKRDFVRFRKIEARYPLEYLCMDIKYVWVAGERRHYYLLTVLDVFSRKAIDWIFLASIRKQQVVSLIIRIASGYDVRGVTVRNDNGSQFLAHEVRRYLKSEEIRQEFTHISTPEENGYIEAFHSNIRRDVLSKTEFSSYYEAKLTLDAYMNHYNQKRRHRAIGKITPQQKWDQGWPLRAVLRQKEAVTSEQFRLMDNHKNPKNHGCIALDTEGDLEGKICQLAEQNDVKAYTTKILNLSES